MYQYTVYKGKILYIWFRKVPNIFNCTLVEPTDLAKTIGAGVLIVDCLYVHDVRVLQQTETESSWSFLNPKEGACTKGIMHHICSHAP